MYMSGLVLVRRVLLYRVLSLKLVGTPYIRMRALKVRCT